MKDLKQYAKTALDWLTSAVLFFVILLIAAIIGTAIWTIMVTFWTIWLGLIVFVVIPIVLISAILED